MADNGIGMSAARREKPQLRLFKYLIDGYLAKNAYATPMLRQSEKPKTLRKAEVMAKLQLDISIAEYSFTSLA